MPDTSDPEGAAAAEVRALLLDPAGLVRAVASGARRGSAPRWRRAVLRPVELGAGRRLQVEAFDERQSFTSNHPYDDPGPDGAAAAVDSLLAAGFGSWHVDGVDGSVSWRFSAKGRPLLQHGPPAQAPPATGEHDRRKARLLEESHPVLRALGISDSQGRVKPGRRAKHRQVEQFLRLLEHAIADAGITPTESEPLRLVDLGCGNAYLTLAAVAWLEAAGLPVSVVGVDVKAQALEHNQAVAAGLGWGADVRFVRATIAETPLDVAGGRPDVVVALHACDTATDDALAFAVRSSARVLLAAPCCHHDVQRQMQGQGPPEPYALLTRHGILRERFGDVLTDAVRAAVLRLLGYRVDVAEFVGGEHTPRNLMIRAVDAHVPVPQALWREYDDMVEQWSLVPHLAVLLADELKGARGG